MKFSKELIKKAHKLTKEIKNEFPEVSYQFQFGISMKYLLSNREGKEMVDLKGTEKQISWAEKIRAEKIEGLEKDVAFFSKKVKKMKAAGKNTIKGDAILSNYKKTIEILENAENAGIWIENRDESFTPNKDRIAYATERFIED